MPLKLPNLDNRDFDTLVEEAMVVARRRTPAWTDQAVADPGRALVEAFAHMTEIMLYRVNRVPEKNYVAFLNLLGGELLPPTAATVRLRFTRKEEGQGPMTIPAGTRVAIGSDNSAGCFTTLALARIDETAQSVETLAVHAEWIEGERLTPMESGTRVLATLARPPVIGPVPGESGLQLGLSLSTKDGALPPGDVGTKRHGDRSFALWNERQRFGDELETGPSFTCVRNTGLVIFTTSAEREKLTAPGAEIRAWYLTGGGSRGNVTPGQVNRLLDPVAGVEVTNPEAASGGSEGERLTAAMERVPREHFGYRRAVTAQDFELTAKLAGGIARAQAFNRSEIWAHAERGSVELLLLPELDRSLHPTRITREALVERQTETLHRRVEATVTERKPLGTRLNVGWIRTKPLGISVRVHLHDGVPWDATRERIEAAINRLISPLDSWPLGRSIRPADVYRVVLGEAGVRTADSVRFAVEEMPVKDVADLAADLHQPSTWFAAAGMAVYRTLNDTRSWERVAAHETWQPQKVLPHPARPGLVAILWTKGATAEGQGRITISRDCGETWLDADEIGFADSWLHDAVWLPEAKPATLVIAARNGLYQWSCDRLEPQRPIVVDPAIDAKGFYAVAATRTAGGRVAIVTAARETRGVHLGYDVPGGFDFRHVGRHGDDIRLLQMRAVGGRRFLWAGTRVAGDTAGDGLWRAELGEDADRFGDWAQLRERWNGGSCNAIAFIGERLFCASFSGGVLEADPVRQPQWHGPDFDSGLPIRGDPRQFQPVRALAGREASAEAESMLLAAGEEGVFRLDSLDGTERTWLRAAVDNPIDEVPLPPTWLFASGEHVVTRVVGDGPA